MARAAVKTLRPVPRWGRVTVLEKVRQQMRGGALALALAGAVQAGPEPSQARMDPWELVATLNFSEAGRAFRHQLEQDNEPRTARLGLALVQLQAQPRKAETVEAVLQSLDELVATEPADRVGITAAFLAARVVQRHREPSTPEEAAVRFRALAEAFPTHPLGQLAWVRWALMVLYDDALTDASLEERLARVEQEGRALTEPVARRDFHLLLAMVYPHLAPSDEATLRHLLGADATGLLRWQSHRDVYVRIVETALVLNRHDVAQEYLARFITTYPRDPRRQLLQERVAAAQGEQT
jgi:hypothetical protein